MRRRIWSELLDHRELAKDRVLMLLRDRGIELLFAVMEAERDSALEVVCACRALGVRVGIWPLLASREGRFASEHTAHALASFGEKLLADLHAADALPDDLVIDLEPPFELLAKPGLRRFARLSLGPRPRDGRARLASFAAHARELGVTVVAAVMPMVLGDADGRGWQELLATPLDVLAADHVSAMVYTSLLEGYSRGLLARRDATAILAGCAALTGARGGLSLGAVGTGSLGDERTYRGVAELAEDVAIARAMGVDDLALFSLCGALTRPPVEAWLDALVSTEAAREVPGTLRARLAMSLVRAVATLPVPRRT